MKIPGVEVFVEPVKEHRFVVVFRGEGLGGNVADTDPQETGVPPLAPVAHDAASQRTAEVAKQFVAQAQKLLAGQPKANGLTMRGFSAAPHLPSYEEVYGLKAAAIAVYPMYKGLARLVGMEIVGKPATLAEEIDVLERAWNDYDFFFVHFKYTDSRGEDGNFAEKVKMIEEFDAVVPRIMALKPTVLVVTGDHSTPAGDEEPQLASRAGAAGGRHLPARRLSVVRRDASASRGGLGQFRGGLPDAAGAGARRPPGQVRGVGRESFSRCPRSPSPPAASGGNGSGNQHHWRRHSHRTQPVGLGGNGTRCRSPCEHAS